MRGRGRGRGNIRGGGAVTGRSDPSSGETSRVPVSDGARGEGRPINRGSGAVLTGREEEGYKNSGEAGDRGDSNETDRGEDSGGDLSGDLEEEPNGSEDLIELEDLGGDPNSNDSLQPD